MTQTSEYPSEYPGLEQMLLDLIDAAISVTGADFGNVQLMDPISGDLKIRVARGFPQDAQHQGAVLGGSAAQIAAAYVFRMSWPG